MKAARIPPQALEAEQATLGAMLLEGAAVDTARSILPGEAFYREAHRLLFGAMLALRERQEPVDLTTLAAEMENRGQLEQAGGRPYLASLLDAVPTWAHCEHYARLVAQKWRLRRLIGAASEILEQCYGEVENADEFLSRAVAAVREVAQGREDGKLLTMRQALDEAVDRYDALTMADEKSPTCGVGSGFAALEKLTNGFQRGNLILLAARPSMGKTALALNLAVNAARAGQRVLFFSMEMGQRELEDRFVQAEAGICSQRLRTGQLDDEQWHQLITAVARLWDLPLVLDVRSGLTVTEMAIRAREAAGEGLGLILVDYIGLMRPERKRENRVQEIAEFSLGLKNLAREMDVPVLALSQLSREVERRADRRPMLSDLRDGGTLEQDADLVMGLFRPEYYRRKGAPAGSPDDSPREIAELLLLKHRNGPTGTVLLRFEPNFARFGDLPDGAAPVEDEAF